MDLKSGIWVSRLGFDLKAGPQGGGRAGTKEKEEKEKEKEKFLHM